MKGVSGTYIFIYLIILKTLYEKSSDFFFNFGDVAQYITYTLCTNFHQCSSTFDYDVYCTSEKFIITPKHQACK